MNAPIRFSFGSVVYDSATHNYTSFGIVSHPIKAILTIRMDSYACGLMKTSSCVSGNVLNCLLAMGKGITACRPCLLPTLLQFGISLHSKVEDNVATSK